MQRKQANRAVIAARMKQVQHVAPRRPATLGTNPALRGTVVGRGGNIGRQYGAYNKGGSGHDGYYSEWSRTTDAPYGGWR